MYKRSNKSGFTLLEILLAVAAIGILAGIVIIAINPAKQLGETRDAERSVDVSTILNAVHQYAVDNGGDYPSDISTTAQQIGTASTGCNTSCTAKTVSVACVDIASDLSPEYIAGLPLDPSIGTAAQTGYYIAETDEGRLVVGACGPEEATSIEVTR